MQGHPKARTLKTAPLVYPDLCIALFEGTSATGSRAYAPSATRERTTVSSSSFTSSIPTTQNEEDGDEEIGPSVDKSSATPSRPNKKSKTKVDMEELAFEVRGAIQTLVAQQTTLVAQTSNLNACMERLNALDLDKRSPL